MIGIAEALGNSVLGMAVVFLMLVVLMAIIVIMGKSMEKKGETPAQVNAPLKAAPLAVLSAVKGPAAMGTAGSVDLHSVDQKTAAMIMAIVADEMKVPLNELRFISIKQI
ncbi:MAG: OadG family protein [Clostridiaceae bacterium]|nr:OadG family protein [Clostridiaceae bacterium]